MSSHLPPNRRTGRRLAPRGGVKVVLRATPLDLGPNLAAGLVDVSDTGARVRVWESLRPGQAVFLTVEATTNGKAVKRQARVVWCRPADAGGVAEAGLVFEKPIGYADLNHVARI
jgi:hypothetical protein